MCVCDVRVIHRVNTHTIRLINISIYTNRFPIVNVDNNQINRQL